MVKAHRSFIATSTDGGSTWVKKDGGISASGVESFAILNPSKGWAVSSRIVYKTTNGGITAVEEPTFEGAPRLFQLDQNYPNPFNPSTTIRYGLPARSHVTLTVINTLGQAVAVLQNGEQAAGYHDAICNAQGLPSGVYFYRLQVRPSDSVLGRDSRGGAGSFTETKRLLLLR